jgi:ABC-2 type transport system permease protein
MHRLARVVRKDVRRKLRSPLGILVVLLFPVGFSAIIALAFGGESHPRVHLLVENRDEGMLGNALLSALDSNQVADYFDVEVVGTEGGARIEAGEASALLRVPATFTADVIDGRPVALELVRNPAQGILPEIAEQTAGVLAEVLSSAAYVLREPLDTLAPLLRDDTATVTSTAVAEIAVAVHGSIEGASRFLDPLAIRLEVVDLGAAAKATKDENANANAKEKQDSSQTLSIFMFVFPGVAVWSLFMVGDLAMRDIVAENEAGTLRRQLQGPLGPGTLIAAKAAFAFVLCGLCLLILSLAGALATDRAVDLAAFVVLSLALVTAVTGAGALIYGAAGKQRLGATIASALYLFLGFAGGSFIALDNMPRAVRSIAPISPFYWGTQGYKALLDGGGLADVAVHAVVLLALGGVTLGLGALLLRRSLA